MYVPLFLLIRPNVQEHNVIITIKQYWEYNLLKYAIINSKKRKKGGKRFIGMKVIISKNFLRPLCLRFHLLRKVLKPELLLSMQGLYVFWDISIDK